ncbi:MAG: hypothetical protein RMY16_02065 [Nostoc sp. DedQUE12b]|uniref:hypothetical protein n=1 Tax=Nostoc sp. DedQUE12b TaxID=3075398 RepID=UPI002AD4C148|nr:hypothetical protein [Nostoc sp. DedQUE12b]MDZ8084369.1 hypothetical protein [Nostoc sp. DedQUE12b]
MYFELTALSIFGYLSSLKAEFSRESGSKKEQPERMQKLKVAGNSRQNLRFDFLQECWSDDPALQIVIKKLLAKFPQWGLVAVEGVLVKWEE